MEILYNIPYRMIHSNFIYLGIFLQCIGASGYFIGTIKGTVKPNRVSWILWALAPFIAFFAQIKQGVGPEVWATFVVGFVPLVIFIASFINKKAVWQIQRLDIICGILSLLGLILWMITKVGNIAITLGILADALASIPTVVKSWAAPETENDSIFLMGVVNAIIGLLVMQNWHFENYAFLIYLFFLNLLLTILIRFKVGKRFR